MTINRTICILDKSAAMIFFMYLSAHAANRLDPEDSGPVIRLCV